MANFTNEQIAAIDSQGKTIVSASAGSGKTTVMIEKIIRLIQDGGSVNEILAVTFTKKAASQMKEKLRKALVKSINAPNVSPQRKKDLKTQLNEVGNADISTIHSFCAKLIRTHFYAKDVDSSFRVINSEDAEGVALQNAALDELLEEGYEGKSEDFMRLLSVYWRKKSDNAFRQMLLETYKELRNRADYREFLEKTEYTSVQFDGVCKDLFALLKEKCAYYLEFIKEEETFFKNAEKEKQLALAVELHDWLHEIYSANDYFAACAVAKPKFTTNRSSNKDSEMMKERIARLGELKTKIVKTIEDELSETGSYEEELQAFLSAGEIARILNGEILKFDKKYETLKKEYGVLDYNDLEHIALALLNQEEIAKAVREKYRFVFVDEYQDVNPVQEEIISKISGKNVFLVGDVKQAIYGFRGSKSKFFVEKQKQFESNCDHNLEMTFNFRSSDAVLNAVNVQFSRAMESYSSMERGGRYALNDGRVQIHLLNEEEKKEEKERGIYSVRASAERKQKQESSIIATTLKKIIDDELQSKWYDPDANDGKGAYKRVQYSDIAILSRKKQGKIALNVAALSDAGIPITSVSAVNICEYGEVKTLLDILSLLDNAEQDVPLCSALLSAMGDCTVDELADIRLAYKDETFFRNACKKYAREKQDKTAAKLRKFFALYQEYRNYSFIADAAEVLTKLVSETRMETRLLSRENGVLCVKRLRRFIEEAANPNACVHEFLRRIRDMEYKIEYNENGGENSVKVLTMHSSKGLEYPVVIIDDLNAPFKGSDTGEVLVEETYGLATRAFDDKKMLKRNTLLRRLYARKDTQSSVADELNLYYVALTRAKYALHALFKKPTLLPDVRYARSFADFTSFQDWQEYIVYDTLFTVPKEERTALAFHPDEALVQEIISAFSWKYPFVGLEDLPVKSSATALMQGGDMHALAGEAQGQAMKIFDEETESYGRTDSERGIAYHAFLENFDFSFLLDENGDKITQEALGREIEKTLSFMREKSEKHTELLEKDVLIQILQNEIFYQLQGFELYKERQFLVSLPIQDTYAKKRGFEYLANATNEEMIFQGAIDLLCVGKDEILIVDYKYSKRDAQELKTHYKPQLDLYRLATAKILHVPVEKVRCSIVNICRGFQVDMD